MEQTEARELLRQLRDAYKQGPEEYDRRVLKREPSTVRRWLRGQAPIPRVIVAWLYNAHPKGPRVADTGSVSDIVPLTDARD